jgi:Ca2+-binding EF-hand superfamily protein
MKLLTKLARVALGAVLLVLAAGPSARAEDLPPTSEFFEEYDANRDGCVTREEFRGSGEVFRLLDKNGDGSVRPDELGLPADFKPDPRRKKRAPGGEAAAGDRGRQADKTRRRFLANLRKMDKDEDGRISKDEFTGPEKAFGRLDRNADGFIDAKDAAARDGGRRRGRDGRGPDGKGPGGKGGRDRKGGGASDEAKARVRRNAQAQFARIDANKDGKLTADEVQSPMLLELADVDGNGEVTLAEFQKVALQRAMRRSEVGGDDGHKGGAGRKSGRGRKGGGRGRLNAGMLEGWDTDGDGRVSPDEFPGRSKMFERIDRNGDGFLTEADVAAARDAKKKPRPDADVIESMDADGDGRLHRGEFRGSAEDWDRLDRNKDGWITPDEQ